MTNYRFLNVVHALDHNTIHGSVAKCGTLRRFPIATEDPVNCKLCQLKLDEGHRA